MKRLVVAAMVVLFVLSLVSVSAATNGYFSSAYSIKNQGLAGAGVALPLDALATSMNPAGMAFVGTRVDVGLSLFNPNRGYTVYGQQSGQGFGLQPGTVESDSELFLIPAFGANWMYNETSALGIALFGNGGMNTNYDTNTFYGSGSTGVDLMQVFLTPTYAVKVHPKHAFGMSAVLAYQTFEARGLQFFGQQGFSRDPNHLTNNGHDNSFGGGFRIGYFGEVLPNLSLGASYQSRIWMSKFDKYEGLFAENASFDIPQNWTAGLAFKATPTLTFAADVQKIYYGDVKAINNPFLPNLFTSKLGDVNGAGFGWEDMTVYKVGVQWQSSDVWTWRAGYSYGEQPIGSSQVLFNILAPGVVQNHLTAGFTMKTTKNQEMDVALIHAFAHSVEGINPMDPVQKIRIRMNQWEGSVGYSWKF